MWDTSQSVIVWASGCHSPPASDENEKNAGFEMNPPGYNNYSLELDNELAAGKMINNNNSIKEKEAERIME